MVLTNSEKQKQYRERKKAKLLGSLISEGIIEFFIKVTKLEPTEKQKAFLLALEDDKILNIIISCGRQTGKSMCCAVAAIYLTLKRSVQICIASAKSNFIYDHISKIFATNPDLAQYVAFSGVDREIPITGYTIKGNNSRVILLTATQKGIRGAPANIFFLDETELMNREAVTAAIGNVSGNQIKIILLGTPSYKPSMFNEIVKSPDKFGFKLFNWGEQECPWHSQAELDTKRKLHSDDEWAREVEGIIPFISIKTLWDYEVINDCIRDVVLSEGKPRIAGLDGGGFGRTNRDKLSLTIVEMIGKFKGKVLVSREWGLDGIETAYAEIGKLMKNYRVIQCRVDSLPIDTIERVKEVFDKSKVFSVTFKAYKEEMQGQLTHILDGKGLEIAITDEQLISELKAYKKEGRPHGDDAVDSLMLAIYSNDILFPVKPAVNGRMTICDSNKGIMITNSGGHLTTTRITNPYLLNGNFVPNLTNNNRQPIYGGRR